MVVKDPPKHGCSTCGRVTRNDGPLCVKCEDDEHGALRTEHTEHAELAKYLNNVGVYWYHPPNDAKLSHKEYKRRKQRGTKNGMVDFVIFRVGGLPDIALELKALKEGRRSKEQEKWEKIFVSCGWVYILADGADDAIKQLLAVKGGLVCRAN